ncbi:MAG TPA: amidohydrolase family protein [Candidatus Obscuribacterales bacterium]
MPVDLSRFIFIDHHAHSLLKGHLQLDALAFRQRFSESRSISQLEKHSLSSLPYRDVLRRLDSLLGKGSEEALLEYRAEQPEQAYLNTLWDDVSIGAMIIDDGFHPAEMMGLSQLAHLSGRPVYRCARIETVLEECLARAGSFTELSRLFQKSFSEHGAVRTVALKSIAAYRGGLELEVVSAQDAHNDFDRVKAQFKTGSSRIKRGKLYHYFLLQAFELAATKNWPVQLHAGIGDDDEDLREADPLCFRKVLHSQAFAKTNFVFLHCYPFVGQAAYLASIYPNVYFDLSLAVSLASPLAADMILEALTVAPVTKLLAGSDGHSIPETHWYGALSWKRGLTHALARLVAEEFLTVPEAEDVAARVLHDNARRLYGLDDLV